MHFPHGNHIGKRMQLYYIHPSASSTVYASFFYTLKSSKNTIIVLIIIFYWLTLIFFSLIHSSTSNAKKTSRRPNLWCQKAPGLSSSQRKLCQRVPGLQTAIKKGIEKGLSECEREFQWNRWNCSLLGEKSLLRRAPGRSASRVVCLENNSMLLLLTPTFVIIGN